MRILLLGASGFIGNALAHGLVAEGYEVTGLGRDLDYGRRSLPAIDWIKGDLRMMRRAGDWARVLEGFDMVVNASGALRSGLRDDVRKVQEEAIVALIEAARAAGVRHMVQISAAGADEQGASLFMATKARADEALARSPLSHTILRPGLVIGRNGFGGTELLRAAAGVPLRFEIAGTGQVQCVALSDLVEAVLRSLRDPQAWLGRFDLVERESRPLGEVIALHRAWLGFSAPRLRLSLPVWALKPVSITADLLGWLGWRSPLRSNSIAALVHGVKGDATQAARLLGREPLGLPATLAALGPAGKADRWQARLALLYPLALAVLVLFWLASGALGIARHETAAQLLVAGGADSRFALIAVMFTSLASLGVAAGLVIRTFLPSALRMSLALTLIYLAGSLVVRPDLWAAPFIPLLMAIPLLLLSIACLAMSGER